MVWTLRFCGATRLTSSTDWSRPTLFLNLPMGSRLQDSFLLCKLTLLAMGNFVRLWYVLLLLWSSSLKEAVDADSLWPTAFFLNWVFVRAKGVAPLEVYGSSVSRRVLCCNYMDVSGLKAGMEPVAVSMGTMVRTR